MKSSKDWSWDAEDEDPADASRLRDAEKLEIVQVSGEEVEFKVFCSSTGG